MVFALVAALLVSTGAPPVVAQEKQEAKPAEEKKKEEKKKEGLPLEPERKVEFTTDEGTWLSLDAAPDGKTLVFELLGDLYTLPVEGGAAKRLSSGLPFDSQPRYSPDGQWLAFLSDRDGAENLWIMKADGSEPKKLSKDENTEFASPTWSPDGQYVIVSRSTWGLRRRHPEGGLAARKGARAALVVDERQTTGAEVKDETRKAKLDKRVAARNAVSPRQAGGIPRRPFQLSGGKGKESARIQTMVPTSSPRCGCSASIRGLPRCLRAP